MQNHIDDTEQKSHQAEFVCETLSANRSKRLLVRSEPALPLLGPLLLQTWRPLPDGDRLLGDGLPLVTLRRSNGETLSSGAEDLR
eukprot:scaffold110325_cov24-Prasinocladus_malaysianus.AAC.1